ncbi:MAG: cytochrome c [Candidatus Dormibacteria bacterium]
MRRRSPPAALVACLLLVGGSALGARAAGAAGSGSPGAAGSFAAQASTGGPIYQHDCLNCHGPTGAGVPGKNEPSDGARFQQRNPTALVIFDVVRSAREPHLRALTDDQIWQAIAAELARQGVDLGGRPLSAANAGTVRTGPAAQLNPRLFFPPGR